MSTRYLHPEALATTTWLADHLDQPDLRVFDGTMYLVADSPNDPYEVVNGEADHALAHIPGANYIDLQRDLSSTDSPFRFTMPAPDEAARRFAALGIGDGSRVVLYSRGNPQWATRLWWMLRSIGFDHAAVLDGGWEKWAAERRPTATHSARYAPATQLTVRPRPELFVDRTSVLAALDDPHATVVNALSAELHAGHSRRYGRPGRIRNSVNVPAASLRDTSSMTLVSPEQARAAFEAADVTRDKRTLIYCGGGIAATLDAFVLYQLGYDQVAVYDHSLNEWANDPSLPLMSD